MSRFRLSLLLMALAISAMLLYAACDGDGDDDSGDGGDDGEVEVTLLPEGEYFPTVSGTIEFTLPEESVSAAVVGPRANTAEVSGSATLNMGTDGSFEIKEWGISGNFQEGGQTQTIEMKDSSAEPTTGTTTTDGTTADVYLETTLSTTTTGTNTDTIGMSGDPLLNTTDTFDLAMNNTAPVDFLNASNETVFTVQDMNLNFDLLGEAPDGDGEAGDGDGGVPFVLVQESVGCAHIGPGDSKVRKLVLVTFVPDSQNRQWGPDGDRSLVVSVTDEGVAPRIGEHPALGGGEPVVGATVTVTASAVSGEGLLPGEESERAVTNEQGEARAEFGINMFGEYDLTVTEVAGTDGTRYQFDPASDLSETFEVGETCEDPLGW